MSKKPAASTASTDLPLPHADRPIASAPGHWVLARAGKRVLRPGGRYAIHELGVTPDDIDEDYYTQLRRDLARSIHVNARPMTAAAWKELMEGAGLVVDWGDTAPPAPARGAPAPDHVAPVIHRDDLAELPRIAGV